MDTLFPVKFSVPPQVAPQYNDPLQDLAAPKTIPLPELENLSPSSSPQPLAPTQSSASFQNLLGDFVNEVSDKQTSANDAVNGLLSGKNVSLHQAVISMEEANVSFQLMVEVRNKLLDSYQELMRMQL